MSGSACVAIFRTESFQFLIPRKTIFPHCNAAILPLELAIGFPAFVLLAHWRFAPRWLEHCRQQWERKVTWPPVPRGVCPSLLSEHQQRAQSEPEACTSCRSSTTTATATSGNSQWQAVVAPEQAWRTAKRVLEQKPCFSSIDWLCAMLERVRGVPREISVFLLISRLGALAHEHQSEGWREVPNTRPSSQCCCVALR
ncbi:hypothetical protein BaRGS_00032375 [Batillaria attramentaria]|uniref:Uncharacterized protein n=1 Tax=Batillaria attramentaria TaxID=370345 RepID=A0ABD0JMW7_9CAEN